jgi:uncharacterized protein
MSGRGRRPPNSSPAVWDGAGLLAAMTTATEQLDAHKETVNALNVFPVPDGDTGTNMALTMRAALDEAAKLDGDQRLQAGTVAERIAYGSLMGARGNSGVILSQIFRGFARAIAERDAIDGRDIAKALTAAREMAYKAVMRPVEGTMLSVIRVAAERAETVAARTPALQAVLSEALTAGREALAETPRQLEILRQAGVVDAGGQGVVHILDGLNRFARGDRAAVAVESGHALGAGMVFLDRIEDLHGDDAFGYCTNFMIFGEGIDFDRVRSELAAMGGSAVIVGDDRIVKVHIHALNPGLVLDCALRHGELGQIKIDNMNAQTQTLAEQRATLAVVTEQASSVPPVGKQAVLAVASGDGLAGILCEMGATGIVRGGQSMNPSVEELLEAVEAAPVDEVILLPNNSNILMAANRAAELTRKRVRVVPTRSVPQGLAALAVFNTEADLEANVADMSAALSNVHTVEVARADKDATIDGLAVVKGQAIGLLDDQLVAAGDDEVAVARDALARAPLDAAELVTIFTGNGASAANADRLEQVIAALKPTLDVQTYRGGQPHYHFVIAVE